MSKSTLNGWRRNAAVLWAVYLVYAGCGTSPGPKADPCAIAPCSNGGECIARDDEFVCRCPDGYGGDRCEGQFADPDGFDGLWGYIHYSTASPPDNFNLGMSFYAAVWPLAPKPLANFQIGLPGTWILPDNRDNPDMPLCPEGTLARDNWPERGPTWDSVFQTLEGGLGYWAGNRFRYGPPKFSMNSTPQCYDYEVASPGWGFFRESQPLVDDRLAVAQLSNRLLIPPDGLPFAGRPNGELLGYGWMAVPFTLARGGDEPIGDHSWTCFLNAANFKGPIAFYVPDAWTQVGKRFDYPFVFGRGLDARPGLMGGGAMEINTVPYFQGQDSSGTVYAKIPQLQFPVDSQGRAVLVRDVTYYSNAALYEPFRHWRDGGREFDGHFREAGQWLADLHTSTPVFRQAGIELAGIDEFVDTEVYDNRSWGLRWSSGYSGQFPQYFKQVGSQRVAVAGDEVPPETGLIQKLFPLADAGAPYIAQARGAWAQPGPVSDEIDVVLADGSQVTYRWYRFVDQPTVRALGWDDATRARVQTLVEKIHASWPISRDYMAPPSQGELAVLDSALMVTPPSEFAVGYVPIVVQQQEAGPDGALFQALELQDLAGRYVRMPASNDWHSGDIVITGDTVAWRNDAGVMWTLIPALSEGLMRTDNSSPYFDSEGGDAFRILLKKDAEGRFVAQVRGFRYVGEVYLRQ